MATSEAGFGRLIRLKALTDYIRTGGPSLDELTQFIALNTFSDRFVSAIFLATVKRDGIVSIISQFGCAAEVFAEVPDRNVSVDVSVNTALRTGAIMDCGSWDTFAISSPSYWSRLFPHGFACCIAFPVPRVGAAYLFCAEPFELNVETEEFLLVVGKLLSMELSGARQLDVDGLPRKPMMASPYVLTSRQWQVYEEIVKGNTNAQISHRLGLNETLVRQDVSKIMTVMGVTERSEISRTKLVNPSSESA